ncbi:MAG: hypothetical protein KDC38_12295, partial [Planctomycetes bacterium]|nr:hypothetical protein [Planctomycetota bacterium]
SDSLEVTATHPDWGETTAAVVLGPAPQVDLTFRPPGRIEIDATSSDFPDLPDRLRVQLKRGDRQVWGALRTRDGRRCVEALVPDRYTVTIRLSCGGGVDLGLGVFEVDVVSDRTTEIPVDIPKTYSVRLNFGSELRGPRQYVLAGPGVSSTFWGTLDEWITTRLPAGDYAVGIVSFAGGNSEVVCRFAVPEQSEIVVPRESEGSGGDR